MNRVLQPDGVHSIPVPIDWSVEQAWEAITRGDEMPTWRGCGWACVLVEHGRFVKVLS